MPPIVAGRRTKKCREIAQRAYFQGGMAGQGAFPLDRWAAGWYTMDRKREYIAQVPAPPGGRCGRIVNQVRILNGTAAVYGEAAHRDESPSLGNREDRAPAADPPVRRPACRHAVPAARHTAEDRFNRGKPAAPMSIGAVFCKPERGTAAAFHGAGRSSHSRPPPYLM